jgi:hypothetical protein
MGALARHYNLPDMFRAGTGQATSSKSPYCRSAYPIARSRAFGSAKIASSQPPSSGSF